MKKTSDIYSDFYNRLDLRVPLSVHSKRQCESQCLYIASRSTTYEQTRRSGR